AGAGMGKTRTAINIETELLNFAQRLQALIGAERVLLFGSRVRGEEHEDSDYDVMIVSSSFEQIELMRRSIGLRKHWYASGGEGSMDLICLTPAEFEDARQRPTLVAAVLPEAIDLLAAA